MLDRQAGMQHALPYALSLLAYTRPVLRPVDAQLPLNWKNMEEAYLGEMVGSIAALLERPTATAHRISQTA